MHRRRRRWQVLHATLPEVRDGRSTAEDEVHQASLVQRLRHALVSAVVTRKTTTGRRTAATGRVSGAMGAGLISRAWQPAAARSVAGGVATRNTFPGRRNGTPMRRPRNTWPRPE